MTGLEIKQKAVVDAKADYDAAKEASDVAKADADDADDHAAITYDDWAKASIVLSDYLKEHGDEHSI